MQLFSADAGPAPPLARVLARPAIGKRREASPDTDLERLKVLRVREIGSLRRDEGRPIDRRGSQRGVNADDLAERVQVWLVGGERVKPELLMALSQKVGCV